MMWAHFFRSGEGTAPAAGSRAGGASGAKQRLTAEHHWEAAHLLETGLKEDWTCSLLYCVCVRGCACFALQAEIQRQNELQRHSLEDLEEALRFILSGSPAHHVNVFLETHRSI